MQEINLLQNRVKDTTHTWQSQSKTLLTVLAVLLIIVVGATAVLFLLNNSLQKKIAAVVTNNQSLKVQLDSKQKDLTGAKAYQAQLTNLKTLVNNHIYLTPLLNELSKSTYQRAQYVTLDATDAGKIHLEGRVANYSDLGKLLLGLSTSAKFKDIKLLSVIPSTGTINAYVFAVDMSVLPEIFSKK